MPRRELKKGQQVADWLERISKSISNPAEIILIGSAALLWHAHDRGLSAELPEGSMDIDPLTDSDEIATICYNSLIGSEFEKEHGWHVNLMPNSILSEFPQDWRRRAASRSLGLLTVVVPAPDDLLIPKLKRNEPRDRVHFNWARSIGLISPT